PAKSYQFSFINPVKGLETNKAGITFPKAMGDKAAYLVSYYEMNLQGQQFREMLRSADGFTYESYIDINYDQIKAMESKFYVRDENFFLNRKDFNELLKKRAEIIRRVYTQLPENLPKRVKDLAVELTKNEDNTYDKLKAIEAFLLKYTYSYKPGKVPEGWDFVDYFLFENKKGYCTSFATSMAVLARCVGIPTRYVEGFLVDYSDRADEGYLVRNSDAHAWVEAYFEGIGWIPFEPTPGFNEIRYTVWPEKTRKTTNDNYVYNIRITQEPHSDLTPAIPEITEDKDKAGNILMWILTACAVILILLGAIVCYYLILRSSYRKEFDRADFSRKMYMLFIRILVMLKYEGFGLSRQETVLLLCDRVKDKYRYGNIIFSDVVDVYMAYRYGEIPVSKEEFETVEAFYKGLSEYRKNNNRKLKQFMEEFAFLIRKNNINIYNY
ncbi:MAG TPA: transglutaminase-like domain-containing protein, partial [Mobilitalea sp.]|nr:transglutaminase-like domain-containing protein [Mobilitalea sp.]